MIDFTVLKTEIQTDPLKLGYAGQDVSAQAGIIDDINQARPVKVHAITGITLLACLNLTEVSIAPLSHAAEWFLGMLAAVVSAELADPNDPHFTAVRDGIFPAITYPLTNAALKGICTRPGSRAEELFGAGTYIQAGDIAVALNS